MENKISIKKTVGVLCAILVVMAIIGGASAQTTTNKKVKANKYIEIKTPVYGIKTSGCIYEWNYAYDHSKLNLYIDQDGNIIVKPLKRGKTEIIAELKETNIASNKVRTVETIKYNVNVKMRWFF